MLGKAKIDFREVEYTRIMAYSRAQPNDETYACMLTSWQQGAGVMADDFGLGARCFAELFDCHFPGLNQHSLNIPERKNDPLRNDEREEVYKLLMAYRANASRSEIWMANIVAVACQGSDHLWQDMGLWSRTQLSELLNRNFPELAHKNINNMKWKKFLYKQLCSTEGIYTCRAPSCEVCTDYTRCFAAED
ncbi:Nitrogenase FeMo-cofactor synthesis molybdenum delivery protein NifQ [hydrothermal vent metagenome]|uniref:Nitrogenase FeMo-cofactor synthesis molybdenum delivery protein NifQ n=1 Tax=hydrothermal vent metagenome TaxID=652676 RepID=A0A3B1BUS4_9ZZZZ